MSVHKDESGRRWVAVEVEVPGTPEQVWRAIATGEGISSWFVPTEMREDGSVVMQFGPGMEVVSQKTAWDPPRRFVKEGEMGPGGPKMATEWIVEARAGGKCLVRVVHSLFASTDDWDDQLGSMESGWPSHFQVLSLYLRHFGGQPCSACQFLTMASLPAPQVWDTTAGSLGLADARLGERRQSPPDAPRLAGTVERVGDAGHPLQCLLKVDEPAPGLVHLLVVGMGGMVMVSIRAFFYGDRAPAAVAAEEPRWQAWLNERFPAVPRAT